MKVAPAQTTSVPAPIPVTERPLFNRPGGQVWQPPHASSSHTDVTSTLLTFEKEKQTQHLEAEAWGEPQAFLYVKQW